MENLINELQNFGLTELEAKIYEKSISLGIFPASSIANLLKIPRSTSRYTCEILVQKGFMTVSQKANTKYFLAENPTKLFAILYDEEEKLKQKRFKLNNIVSELQKNYDPKAKMPKITIYEGIEGIEKMLEFLIKTPTTLYSFGAGDYFLAQNKKLIENFRKKSQNNYKDVYVFRSEKYKTLHKNDPKNYITKYFKYIDELKIDIQIIDDKMTITSLGEPNPVGLIIKHKEIVEAFKQIFIELWQRND